MPGFRVAYRDPGSPGSRNLSKVQLLQKYNSSKVQHPQYYSSHLIFLFIFILYFILPPLPPATSSLRHPPAKYINTIAFFGKQWVRKQRLGCATALPPVALPGRSRKYLRLIQDPWRRIRCSTSLPGIRFPQSPGYPGSRPGNPAKYTEALASARDSSIGSHCSNQTAAGFPAAKTYALISSKHPLIRKKKKYVRERPAITYPPPSLRGKILGPNKR